jgi:hypothetical protein
MLAKEFPPRNFAVLAIEEIQTSTKTVMEGVINVLVDPVKAGRSME